jgi:hypothetical protein
MTLPEVGVAFIRHHRAETADPVVGFEFEGWTRYLTVRGQRWFEIGGGCDKCLFFFERIQSERLSPVELADRLRSGQKLFDPNLLSTVDRLLPSGDYTVFETLIQPKLTRPCLPDDYFCHESLDLFGLDSFTGVPHSPRTPYWRAGSTTLPSDAGAWPGLDGPRPRPANPKLFFHFVVPMDPPIHYDRERVDAYRAELEAGGTPAALGVSVLDIRSPAVESWDKRDDPNYVFAEHWCLATYLLDGHHKMQAAAEANKPIRLLGFLSLGQSHASEKDVDDLLKVL